MAPPAPRTVKQRRWAGPACRHIGGEKEREREEGKTGASVLEAAASGSGGTEDACGREALRNPRKDKRKLGIYLANRIRRRSQRSHGEADEKQGG